MKISREKLLKPREKDNKKKFCQELELLNLRNSKKRRLLRNLKLREWSKSSLRLKLCKRPRLLLQRRQLPRLILLD